MKKSAFTKIMNNSTFAKKLPFYYAAGVFVASVLYVSLSNSDLFLAIRKSDSSHAATNQAYSAVQVFNQSGTAGDTAQGWFGGDTQSYLGLQFANVALPTSSTLTGAYLEFTPNSSQWIGQKTIVFGEKSDPPTMFSTNSQPSGRNKTAASVTYEDNSNWSKDQTYRFPAITSVVREIIAPGNTKTLSFILQGGGGKYGRKFFYPSGDKAPKLILEYTVTVATAPTSAPTAVTATAKPSAVPTPVKTNAPTATSAPSTPTATMAPAHTMPTSTNGESMAMLAWKVGGKNAPDSKYDKCDDGTDVVAAHNQYYVIAYDGIKYPTWHPPVVTNPITGVGKCYFGHEHGTNPQNYVHWDEMVQHFGKDLNGDGKIAGLSINSVGQITPGDRAGIPFGIANEHMDQYYNKEGRDSIFVRHEDHVGHKIELVNSEAETQGISTHTMAQLPGTLGINVPYYKQGSNTYQPTGVVCTHLHKFHQGTNSADAVRNNLHEVIFHSTCQSTTADGINAASVYPGNTVLLTGMMSFGNPGGYKRFCFNSRATLVCPDGFNADGKTCKVLDPLISKLPPAINSDSIGRNMVDKYCFDNFKALNKDVNYFNPYEIWEGDLRIQKATGDMLAEHGRQWDVLDPVRYVDPNGVNGIGYNQDRCNANLPYSGNCDRGIRGAAWNSPQAAFKGLQRTAYFGRNRVSNPGTTSVWWTDPLGGNAVTGQFTSGLKQKISTVEADIQKVQSLVQKTKGSDAFLNDRAIQRYFNNGNNTVHAPN
jgi:hypothetical protein